jgi:hypothetical protein
MEIASDGIAKRVTGDVFDEFPEGAYRAIANEFRRRTRAKLHKLLVDKLAEAEVNPQVKAFFKSQPGEIILGSVIGFGVSFFLEFLPGSIPLQDQRRRVAYNLRVQSWEEGAASAGGVALWLLKLMTAAARKEETGDSTFTKLIDSTFTKLIHVVTQAIAELKADLKEDVEELDRKLLRSRTGGGSGPEAEQRPGPVSKGSSWPDEEQIPQSAGKNFGPVASKRPKRP